MKSLALACFLLTLGCLQMAAAGSLPKPQGTPILTISGSIRNSNAAGEAQLDREMLEALGLQTVVTSTPWFDGKVTFEGVLLDKLMEMVGAEGKTVTAVALNDYVTTIPMEDFGRFGVLLSLKRDGQYMTVRDKGPLFIVYPYDDNTELQSQTYYGRSAWQLARLIIE
ncbi:MAG TPA: oxidoreductase [Pseudorhizobium sp.]|nr:oxidoreductase [Pseudorhizobium sp.]